MNDLMYGLMSYDYTLWNEYVFDKGWLINCSSNIHKDNQSTSKHFIENLNS
jgi:hypothetical protein